MSLLTTAYLLEKYGPLLTEEQLAEVLHAEPGTVRNRRARGELGIPFTRHGKTPLYPAEEVAAHIAQMPRFAA